MEKIGESWVAAAPSLGQEPGAALKCTTVPTAPYYSQY